MSSQGPAPPGGDVSKASLLIAGTWPFAGISVILFCLRVYTRLDKWRTSPPWEDVALSVAMVL
jgi:hypothetical protein